MDMPEKKRQHFVPQFYLRNFGSGPQRRRISLFNIPSAQYVPHASIKNQARKAWFYGQESLVEKALVNIEGSAAQVISGLIAGSALPAKNTLDPSSTVVNLKLPFKGHYRAWEEVLAS